MPDATIHILPVTLADLPAIWAIEATLIGPWTEDQLRAELSLAHGWGWVAKEGDDGAALGYIFGSRVLDEAEIRKLAVAISHRRQGLANLLLSTACQDLVRRGASRCFLELRSANLPAFRLYQKNDFHLVGRRKSYYTGPSDDAIILEKILPSPHDPRPAGPSADGGPA